MTKTSHSEVSFRFCSCPNCGKDMGKTYDEDEKDLPACTICGTQTKFSQNKKYEEIKKMAWEIFLNWNTLKDPYLNPASAWENAKDFYDFMKEQKQEEVSDG